MQKLVTTNKQKTFWHYTAHTHSRITIGLHRSIQIAGLDNDGHYTHSLHCDRSILNLEVVIDVWQSQDNFLIGSVVQYCVTSIALL